MGNQFTRFQCWDILKSNLRIPSRSQLTTAVLLQTSPPVWTPAYLLHDNQLASSTGTQCICCSLLKLQPTFPGTFLLKYLFKITMFTQTQPHFWFQEMGNPTDRRFNCTFSMQYIWSSVLSAGLCSWQRELIWEQSTVIWWWKCYYSGRKVVKTPSHCKKEQTEIFLVLYLKRCLSHLANKSCRRHISKAVTGLKLI